MCGLTCAGWEILAGWWRRMGRGALWEIRVRSLLFILLRRIVRRAMIRLALHFTNAVVYI